MMTYEKPKLTMVCDDTEVLGKVPNELYYWEMDREAGEAVIFCCFEKIEPWEYLAGIGKPVISRYVEELNDKACFRRLENPREICRIECDVDEDDPVLDLNNCDPWQFPVRNEPRYDEWLEDYLDEELETFHSCDRDSLFPKRLAVRKEGIWWIVELDTMEVWENGFRTLELLTGCNNEALFLAEGTNGYQYGLFLNGFDDQCTNLQGDEWEEDGEFEEPWTRVCHVDGTLVLLERICDGEVVARKLMDAFGEVIAEDALEDIQNEESFTVSGYPLLWVECRGEVTLLDVTDTTSGFRAFNLPTLERQGNYELVDRLGDACVLREHRQGPGTYHAVQGHTFVHGNWDDARVVRNPWYEDAHVFLVKKDGLWGVIDPHGEVLIPIRFAAIYEIGEKGEDLLLELDSFDTVRMGSLHAEPRLDGEGGCPGVFDFGERWDPTEKPVDYTWEFRLDPL